MGSGLLLSGGDSSWDESWTARQLGGKAAGRSWRMRRRRGASCFRERSDVGFGAAMAGTPFRGFLKKMEKERPAVGTPFRPEYARVRVCARMQGSYAGQSNSPSCGRPAGILADPTRPDNNYCCRDASSSGC